MGAIQATNRPVPSTKDARGRPPAVHSDRVTRELSASELASRLRSPGRSDGGPERLESLLVLVIPGNSTHQGFAVCTVDPVHLRCEDCVGRGFLYLSPRSRESVRAQTPPPRLAWFEASRYG